jgi:hypothetical protein
MAEEPEEVLIQHRHPSTDNGIDVRSEVPVGEEHHHGGGEDGEGDEDEDGGDEHGPREQGASEHGETGGAQIEDRRHQVDAGEDGGEARQGDGQDPQVGPGTG